MLTFNNYNGTSAPAYTLPNQATLPGAAPMSTPRTAGVPQPAVQKPVDLQYLIAMQPWKYLPRANVVQRDANGVPLPPGQMTPIPQSGPPQMFNAARAGNVHAGDGSGITAAQFTGQAGPGSQQMGSNQSMNQPGPGQNWGLGNFYTPHQAGDAQNVSNSTLGANSIGANFLGSYLPRLKGN